ncbi:hypothetical protein C0033_24745 [Clostridium sp. chh4-2]|uniref:hypothetical protein n=1 Tax=Clostridium sp. chh4-2 TaxID=2067550 RepID=UPI000CCE777F|nr:hypothetical protein [Clostridium sp. chh4-2]PNV59271.1 hypothetical protein C0033_24745 [Clostridium sp. chh4-2]
MKKRWIGILLTAALVAAQPASAFAAQSPSTNVSISGSDSNGYYDDSKSGSTTTGNSAAANTNTVSTAGTTSANSVSVEGASASGTATVGDTQVGFATGAAATAGLPEQTVAVINAINAGNTLADVVKDVDLSGYSALTSVQAIVTKDVNTNQAKTGEVTVSLYVPNLIQGLNNVQVLFYDNSTGLWKLINPANVDAANKKITVNISGSGSFSVVYKK